MEHDDALDLLRRSHTFPGNFDFRVVTRQGASASVTTAICAAVPDLEVTGMSERASRDGTYQALRIKTRVHSAEEVLEVYDILRRLEQVIVSL